MARGNNRNPIFQTDSDRLLFLNILCDTIRLHNWICHAYCLMDNHYHLLIETPDANLAQGMRDVNGRYTQAFHRTHGSIGHVLQGRYKSKVVEKDAYLLEVARYIVLNPVRARSVKDPSSWRWSSYLSTAGLRKPESFLSIASLLNLFSQDRNTAFKEYRSFVASGIDHDSPYQGNKGSILGSPQFIHEIWENFPQLEEVVDISKENRMIGRPTLEDIFSNTAHKAERDVAIRMARYRCGYAISEIAEYLGLDASTVSRIFHGKR